MILVTVGSVVGTFIVIGLLIQVLQRAVPHPLRQQHNEVAGFVYAVMGVLFAVVLAFVVVNEWEALDTAKQNTFTEADELGSLYWNSRAMPADVGRALETTTKEYASLVIDQEWPLLDSGGYSTRATDLVYQMRDEINALPSDTPREQTLYDQSLQHINNLAAARRARLSESSDKVPAILWAALIMGAVLTVGYTFLFGLPKFWSHVLIAGPLAALVVLGLVVIELLDHPFGGMIAVQPEAFEIFLRGLPVQR
ncbi:MAG TPA: hypothetical protein VG317_17270 [Pseudonocardiaceae bacterium]|jgi:hypothetical protein|nr:hypothetical protein [Pseudonocardiaceae bacterium]